MPWLAKMSHGFAAASHNALSDTRMAVEAARGGCMLSVRANVLLLVRPGAVLRYVSLAAVIPARARALLSDFATLLHDCHRPTTEIEHNLGTAL